MLFIKVIHTTQKMQHEFTIKGWRETKIKNSFTFLEKMKHILAYFKKKEYLQYYRNNTLN